MKAYYEGRKAFWKGNLGNPYRENTNKNRDWEFGFNKAYFENLQKVQKREQSRGRSKGIRKKAAA